MTTKNRIHYNKTFDKIYAYGGKDLGAVCTREKTVFKIWAPQASRVILRLYGSGNTGEGNPSPGILCCDMEPAESGVFTHEVIGDIHGRYYDYEIIRGEEHTVTADPYAVSCGCNGMLSMVTDLRRTDPDGFSEDRQPDPVKEQIIYELHIKDFSYDPDSGIPEEYRGKFKAFTVDSSGGKYKTGVAYLKDLGVTHVHLLPFYDYAVIDERHGEEQFNWGYDPLNYNVPEGSYATNPFDGTVRVRECKEMIQALHRAGIRVVMDVVYNHTYSEDSWLERTVPGYYCRRWKDGSLCNGSACGNDMAAGRAMVDNYIADSVMYWAKEYHIDGFRFDLMGLLTVELMNRIRKELDDAFGKDTILLYGEPWRAAESAMEEGTIPALKSELRKLSNQIAVFSDDTRDVIKGHVFDAEEPGFVNGGQGLEQKILSGASAWRKGGGFTKPKSASQIVNYISAHDNLTLWDKLVFTMKKNVSAEKTEIFTEKDPELLAVNKLAAMIYFSYQGHLFFQAGEEFGRTKLGDENSFRSDPKINMLRWKQTEEFGDLVEYYKGLIRLRKKCPGLYDKSPMAYTRISEERILGEHVVSYQVDNRLQKSQGESVGEAPYSRLLMVFNASGESASAKLPEGEWFVLADGEQTDCCYAAQRSPEGTCEIPAHTGKIFGKK